MLLEQVFPPGASAIPAASPVYRYGVYGISLRSQIPLPLPQHPDGGLAEIELQTAPASVFSELTRDVALGPPSCWMSS